MSFVAMGINGFKIEIVYLKSDAVTYEAICVKECVTDVNIEKETEICFAASSEKSDPQK